MRYRHQELKATKFDPVLQRERELAYSANGSIASAIKVLTELRRLNPDRTKKTDAALRKLNALAIEVSNIVPWRTEDADESPR